MIDPGSGLDRLADVAIEADRVVRIEPGLDRTGADRVVDARGCIVAPGLIDPHVHLREPGQEHKETIAGGTAAAVAGGFSTVCCMPNTEPALDRPEVLEALRSRVSATARCRVFPVAAVTLGRQGRTPTDLEALARSGAVGFSDDGSCVADGVVLESAMRRIAALRLALMQHCQDPEATAGATIHEGPVSLRVGLTGWPRQAEESIARRDLALVRSTGCRYHVQHVSSEGTVELIARARAEGLPVSGEVTPHHLLLTCDACVTPDGHGLRTEAKVNPPLREERDVAALRAGVAEGIITVLATDHAPHAVDEKAWDFERAPFGMIGLETAVALYAEALVDSGLIDWPRLIALMTIEPARLCGLDRAGALGLGLGELRAGGPADVTVIDPEVRWTIEPAKLAGQARNTPFAGRTVRGRVRATIVGGRLIHCDGRDGAERSAAPEL